MKVDKAFNIKWIDGKEHLEIIFTLDLGGGVNAQIIQELSFGETSTLRHDLEQAKKQREKGRMKVDNSSRVKAIRWEEDA